MSNSRVRALEATLSDLRSGKSITLESAARAAKLTKAGLMYHFPTKEALMFGLVDHVAARWEVGLENQLARPKDEASAKERITAYVDYAFTSEFDESDIIMLGDPRLRGPLAARWAEQLASWVSIPDDLPAEQKARLTAARLLADGIWFASASGVFAPSTTETERIHKIAYSFLRD